jgi:hypothetical protein
MVTYVGYKTEANYVRNCVREDGYLRERFRELDRGERK